MTKIPDISIVVPVFNSENIIPEMFNRIYNVMHDSKISFETIFVNDFSTDNSANVLEACSREKINCLLIHNEKNLGQAFTTLKGIENAKGEFIVTIDDDLEYEPKDILLLFHKIKSTNSDLVFGIAPDKYIKQGKSTIFSTFRNQMLNFFWRKPQTDSFKIFRRNLVFSEDVCMLNEPFESYITKKKASIKMDYQRVSYNKRYYGESNYTMIKKIKLFFEINKHI